MQLHGSSPCLTRSAGRACARARSSNRLGLRLLAVLLVLSVLHVSLVSTGFAADGGLDRNEAAESTASQFGLGTASFFLTIPYGLVKVVYATLGGIVGGFTYALTAGNERAAKSVWHTSLRGTYVITPDHLRGDRAVRFFGMPPEAAPEPSDPTMEPAPGMAP